MPKEKKVKRAKRAGKLEDIFTPKVVETIFSKMEVGVSLKKACDELGLARSSFLKYVSKDDQLYEQYARVRTAGQDALFESLGDYVRNSTDSEATKRLYVDVLKWQLSKQQPKKYGDKIEVEGKNIGPTIIQITRANDE